MRQFLLFTGFILLSSATLAQSPSIRSDRTDGDVPRKSYDWGVELNSYIFEYGGAVQNVQAVYRYNVCDYFSAGVGAGFLVPFGELAIGIDYFGRVQMEFPAGKARPLLACDIGGMVLSDSDPGFFAFVNPVMGLSFSLRNADCIELGIGYQYIWRKVSGLKYYSNNVTLRFGYRF